MSEEKKPQDPCNQAPAPEPDSTTQPEPAEGGQACPGPHTVITPQQPPPEPAPEKVMEANQAGAAGEAAVARAMSQRGLSTEAIAFVAWKANLAFRTAIGEKVDDISWMDLADEFKHGIMDGVARIAGDPDLSAADSHANWIAWKTAKGWTYGPQIDNANNRHPNMVPWDELPPEQQVKDVLFGAIVRSLQGLRPKNPPAGNGDCCA